MDGWEPLELRLFSRQLSAWTAVLYRLIEEGAPWPTSTRHAKIAHLEKQGSGLGEVMPYRPLTIMSPLYRRWASLRLKCLGRRVSKWALPQIYAGVAQQGAADATYQVLSDVEKMTLEGTRFCRGAADIFKFFDQILRQLAYVLLRLAGMPRGVLEAYQRFLEDW